jgi:hypothetical protein
MSNKQLKAHEALYTPDVILMQLGDIKDIKTIANSLDSTVSISVVPDFFPKLKEKYNLKGYSSIKKLSDVKNMDFTQDLFYYYFENVFSEIQNGTIKADVPNILIVERNFLDMIYLLKSHSKLLYETNSTILCNYRLYDMVKGLMSFSFTRGLVQIPNLHDPNGFFYRKDFLVAAKNYLSYCNYASVSFAHSLPINYDFYVAEEGTMLPIIDYEIENNAHLDTSIISELIDTLEGSELKDKFQKYLTTVPASANLLHDNFVWGQIITTLLHYYTSKLSYICKKERTMLADMLERVLSPRNSNSFLTIELKDAIAIATAIRKEKKNQHNIVMPKEQKYLN